MITYEKLFDPNLFKRELEATHFDEKSLGITRYLEAMILPCRELPSGRSGGGVVANDGSFVKESTVHNNSHIPYPLGEDEVKYRDEAVIYFGMLIGVLGHCITDCIKRAWFFKSNIFQRDFSSYKVVYIAPQGSLHPNFLSVLSKLGIDIAAFEEIKEPTKFKEIIIPDSSFFLDENRVDHFTIEYKDCIDRIKSGFVCDDRQKITKKIYYSHRNVRGYNNDIGEEKIERYLASHGFEIIHPEKLTFDEQLKLLSQCSLFVASDGSTSHNSIFLPESAEIVIIPRSPYLTFHQLALNELYEQQKIQYVDSSLSLLCKGDRPTRGPFFYFVSNKLVETIEKRKLDETPEYLRSNFKDFKKYMNGGFYIQDNRQFTAYSPYSEIAFYYYNKYLFTNKLKCKIVDAKRKMNELGIKAYRKISRRISRS